MPSPKLGFSIPAIDVTPQVYRTTFPEIATLVVTSYLTNKNFPNM
jgi:hypothetical protein